jgi:uncharacterized protein YrzB (UPF0473 family)
MERDNEELEEMIVLTDEEGHEHNFELIDTVEVEGKVYAVLVPVSEEEDYGEDEAVIFRIEEDEDGESIFVEIEDDDEWDNVRDVWENMADEEGFMDEDDEDEEDLDDDDDEEEYDDEDDEDD